MGAYSSRKSVMTVALVLSLSLALTVGLPACSKLKDAARDMQPGQAFLDSRIPAGLSPQYYPPDGFVWSAYRSGSLPEARYGVASPPVNPRAQVLILADADYPAEVYFELMRQLLDKGYGAWLLEAPGQGGSGHYLLQNQSIFASSYHDGQLVARDFIKDIIKPSADKPVFVIGTGYSAITALSLSTMLKDDNLKGFIGYAPYLGGPIARGDAWHRDTVQPGYWGGIAQNWRMSNPDLRMSQKSESWQKQMQKAYADLNGLHLSVTSLKKGAQVIIIKAKFGTPPQANTALALCARLSHCEILADSDEQTLGDDLTRFIQSQLLSVH
jgi:hypothetical protein